MSILFKPLHQIDEDDIKSLVENQTPEGEKLEYKEQIPFQEKNIPDEKKEFLKDISSFANKSGGRIIYGISDKIELCGLSLNKSVDAVKRQLVDIISTGLTPSFNDLEFKEILTDGKRVLILDIPESWNKPHMVMVDKKDVGSFWIRNNSQKMTMPYDILRRSFSEFSFIKQEIKGFVADAIEKIGSIF